MMKRLFFLVLSSFSMHCFSQEDSAAKAMDEVVMVAQRIKQNKLRIPYSVETVSRKIILELQPRTTPEALNGVNGVFVQKTNHGGGSPFLRGLTGNQVLVLVDGIRLNNSTFRYGPNQYLNTIDAYTINRIEVAKGTGSVQYGSDALGGVIQVLTKEPELTAQRSFKGRAIAKYMTGAMEKTYRGDAGYSTKKFALNIGGASRTFGDLIGGDTTGKQSPSGYKEWSYDVKAKWLLKEGAELIIANQLVKQSGIPVYHKVKLENFAVNEMDPQQRMVSYARLRLQGRNNLVKELEFTGSWQKTIEGRASRKNGSNVLRREEDEVSTIGLTIDNFSQIKSFWTANSGIEIYSDAVRSNRNDINLQNGTVKNFRGLYPDNSGYDNYSVYSLHHFNWKKFIVDAGLRYNIFSIRIRDTSLGRVRISPSALVANAGVMYSIVKDHNLYVSYSSGYRAPNVDDMGTLGVVDFRYEIPTASLKPERSQSIEGGYKFKTKGLSGSVAAYYMHIDDLIARVKKEGEVINGYPVYKKENVEKAYIKGVETSLEWSLANKFSIGGNLAYAYGQSRTRNEPLRRIPPLHGRLLAAWFTKQFSFNAEYLFASKQDRLAQGDKDDNRIPGGGTPGWQVVNFYAGYSIRKYAINISAQNIFDKDYRTHGSGINSVGRSAWLSVTVNL
ncbi:MAG TPA: TonB-dependent receptor [Flavisolibacter sp.]|nr:TonB-dependent receptor [Flavisolibacter sp.]